MTISSAGRMLLCVRERTITDTHNHSSLQRQFSNGRGQKFDDGVVASGTRVSHFLPTSRRIVQFSNGRVCLFKDLSLLVCLLVSIVAMKDSLSSKFLVLFIVLINVFM